MKNRGAAISALEFTVIASGSRGNSTVVSSGAGLLVVDQGLSHREFVRRLRERGMDPREIAGVVVTHEHGDHLHGVGILARKLHVPVYITPDTFRAGARYFRGGEEVRFISGDFSCCGLRITPVPISHDVADPRAYILENDNHRLGIVTDLGMVTQLVRQRLKNLDALLLESNHSARMLREGPYPWHLKQRIAGRQGHLSNDQAGELLRDLDPATRLVYLAHLSEENNDPELALNSAWKYLEAGGRLNVRLKTALQDMPGDTESIDNREAVEEK